MSNPKPTSDIAAPVVAATAATTTATTVTPKAGTNPTNTYSKRTITDKISQLQELLKVTNESLEDK
jgi:hypothetical protein